MANVKISNLTAATTPVAGTEVLPIVQSGATVKVSIANLTPGLDTITAVKGGTGQTSYAVGDLLYASTTTALSKLADVATGNALISGGVSTAPSWGKIGLTTHVSGTLPTANGGTNLTSFTANGVVYASSSSALTTGSALVFDGSNLGVGVTPSTWNGYTALQIKATSLSSAGTESQLAANAYYNAGWKYYASNGIGVSRYEQYNGIHSWYSAPSGTAGNAITFTQAMTLDASGNLGIGTSSPGAKLDVAGVARTQNTADRDGITIKRTNNANANGALNFTGSDDVVDAAIAMATDVADAMTFRTAGTERARIDSSGNLLVGTTASNGGRFRVLGNNGSFAATFSANSSTLPVIEVITSANNTTQQALYVYSESNAANNAIIYSNGNIVNRNNSYGGISDAKLKENIVDATPKLAQLNQIRVVNYNLIGETTKQLGVVAQELEAVFPSMVDESSDKDREGNDLGTTTKSVKYSVFVPMLIKAMQEQQALITQLTARITALESA